MTPATYSFTIYQGTTWEREITMKVDDVVVDLSDYSARMTIRRTYGSVALLELTSGAGGGIVLSAASPTPNILVTITAAQTTLLDFVKAVYNFELVAPSGKVDRILEGVVTLSPEVAT